MSLVTPPTTGLGLERELLVEMADSAARQDGPDRADWLALADRTHGVLVDEPDAEQALDRAAAQLRRLLLRRGHLLDESFLRSADLSRPRVLPGGAVLQHSYERNLPSLGLEQRLATRSPDLPKGWSRRTLALSSGMAGLVHVVQTLGYVLGEAGEPVRLDFWGDYFETDIMLEYLSGPGMTPRKLAVDVGPVVGSEPVDVVLIEPVRYNWTLDLVDPRELVRQWQRGPHRPSVVVLDTTLSSPMWPTTSVLAALAAPGAGGAPMVIEVRSGLKLDQQGLEIANLGVVDVFSHEGSRLPMLTAEVFARTLELARGTAGACLSAAALASLDAPFLLDQRWTRRHAGAVYHHNARLADQLQSEVGGLFATVAHPSLHGTGHAPFAVLELREDNLDNHGFLLGVVRHEVARRGLLATHGSSFGFRGPRFETIIPRLSEGNGLFKVAAGSRGGPSLAGLKDLLVELAGFPSMRSLRATYADVTPVRLP